MDVERTLRATAVAPRETRVPITTRTSVGHRNGVDQQRIFDEEGVTVENPRRVFASRKPC